MTSNDEPTWILRRVKASGWLKWFKKDTGVLDMGVFAMTGDYDHMLELGQRYSTNLVIIDNEDTV